MSSATIKDKARHELRNYAFVSGYLFICFAVLWFYETTWSDDKAAMANLAAVAVKALVLGKFILLGEAFGVGERSWRSHLLGSIIGKSLQFLVLLVLLTILEELIVGWYHGVTFGQTLAEFERHTVVQMFAKCLLALLILLPLIAIKEFSRTLGPGRLKSLLLGSGPESP